MRRFVEGALLALALLACAWQAAPASPAVWQDGAGEKKAESSPPGQSSRARVLFGERCARCHGADGRGRTTLGRMLEAPDFTDEEWWGGAERSRERLVSSITEGRGEMPAFGRKLSRREIGSLAEYVRGFRKADR